MDWDLVLSIVLLVVGMALLIKGADWFVDGSSKIAKALKIPSLIIGLTLVSMGTSAPEASVSLNAAIKGLEEASIGNVVGSNIFNTLVVVGVSAMFTPLFFTDEMKKYDIPVMLGVSLILILFGYVTTPLTLDLVESIILLVLFAGYIAFLIFRSKKNPPQENEEEKNEPITKWYVIKSIIFATVGLAGIIFGGQLVVDNAVIVGEKVGMSEALISLTILAIGTSLPELVTSIVASIKKENDIAIGNVVGSNIFNILFILGFSSTISQLGLVWQGLFDMIIMIVAGIVLYFAAFTFKKINRVYGIVMILMYVAYLAYIIIRN